MWDQETGSLSRVRCISICKYKAKLTSALKLPEKGSSSPWRLNYLGTYGSSPAIQHTAPSIWQQWILETSPALNCSDSPLPPGSWSRCLSWALSKRQRYIFERQYTHSPFPQPSVPLLGKPTLLRVFVSTAGLAWPSLTLHLNLFVSNVWVVDVGIHTTETSLQLSLFFPPTWWNHHLWGQGQDPHNYNLNLSLLHFLFSHPADAQYLILPSQLVIFFEIREKTPVSTLQMGTISDFFSIISGFGTMQVHSQCQHFLIGESFLSSVMHFLVKFDSSFSRLQCRLWSG